MLILKTTIANNVQTQSQIIIKTKNQQETLKALKAVLDKINNDNGFEVDNRKNSPKTITENNFLKSQQH